MRTIRITAVLLGLLLTVPAFLLASSGQSQSKSSAPKTTPASSAVHATKGVVKSVDDTSLVITRPSGKVKEMTFVISPGTARKGALATGATVEVRYRTDAKQNIATAVTVQEHK